MSKTLEIPVRICLCGDEMRLVCFRPYDGKRKGEADYYRLRWECKSCNNTANVTVCFP